jgi:hypothetical protein
METMDKLIGKQVKIRTKYSDAPEGPYEVVGIDMGFLGVRRGDDIFWLNSNYLEAITEIREEVKDEKQ